MLVTTIRLTDATLDGPARSATIKSVVPSATAVISATAVMSAAAIIAMPAAVIVVVMVFPWMVPDTDMNAGRGAYGNTLRHRPIDRNWRSRKHCDGYNSCSYRDRSTHIILPAKIKRHQGD